MTCLMCLCNEGYYTETRRERTRFGRFVVVSLLRRCLCSCHDRGTTP